MMASPSGGVTVVGDRAALVTDMVEFPTHPTWSPAQPQRPAVAAPVAESPAQSARPGPPPFEEVSAAAPLAFAPSEHAPVGTCSGACGPEGRTLSLRLQPWLSMHPLVLSLVVPRRCPIPTRVRVRRTAGPRQEQTMDCRPGVATQSLPQHPMPVLQRRTDRERPRRGWRQRTCSSSGGPGWRQGANRSRSAAPSPQGASSGTAGGGDQQALLRRGCTPASTVRSHRLRGSIGTWSPLRRRPRPPSPRRFRASSSCTVGT